MGRYLVPKSFTLFVDQVRYILDHIGDRRGEQSRWVREAVDDKIKAELLESGVDAESYLNSVKDERRRR